MVCCKIDHGTLCRYTITIGTVPLEQVLHSIHIRFHKGILVQRQSAVIFHSDADLRQLLTVGNGGIPQRFRADRKSTRLNSSHASKSRMPSSA